MVHLDRPSLDSLKPLSDKLHADALADKINSLISPPHPSGSGVLRLCMTKRRHFMLYEKKGDGGWSQHSKPTHAHIAAFEEYMDLCVERATDCGMSMFCYEPG